MIVKKCQLLFIVVASVITFYAQSSERKATNTILLEGPSTSAEALYVQAILQKIYAKLGYQIAYENVPLARSFIEANSGRLDGLRARVGDVEKDYPNLVKIPFPILHFDLVMIADRRKCGACNINTISRVATTRGFRAFETFRLAQENPIDVIYTTRPKQAFEMLMEGRVEGAVMSSTNVPPEFYTMGQEWIKTTLVSLPDYHYIHKKHEHLVPELLVTLQEMEKSGELQDLQKTYGLSDLFYNKEIVDYGVVNGATAQWYQYTDSKDGTYFKILDSALAKVASDVVTKVTNWKRAKQSFYDGEADILIGAYAFERGENGILSDIHIDYEIPVTAFAKSEETLQSVLSGSSPGTACFILGYEFKVALPDTVEIHEVPKIDDCIRLVDNGRVDIFLDYELDLFESEIARFVKKEVLKGAPLFVVFQNNPRGRGLKYHFEKNMRAMLESGKLKSLFPNEKEFYSANFGIQP